MSFAHESAEGTYRWWLEDGGPNQVGFCMLNPSVASATVDDPTKNKCMGFARKFMYNGIAIANVYPYRATDPAVMLAAGADYAARWEINRHYLDALASLPLVVVAWGNHCPPEHAARVLQVLRKPGRPLFCLGVNKTGQPKHPLYVPYTTRLLEYVN